MFSFFRFGVIVAFATNSYLQYGIDDSTSVVRAGSNDTQTFLHVTSEQLEYVLINNYKQLSDQLELILRGMYFLLKRIILIILLILCKICLLFYRNIRFYYNSIGAKINGRFSGLSYRFP